MLNFTVLKSAADAKKYYSASGYDYWVEDKDQYAFFGGKLADRLGLTEFNVEAFHDLCDGIVPGTRRSDPKTGQLIADSGEQLTPGKKENKRAGWDVTIDGPKDLGVLLALGLDERVIHEALEKAGREVMAEIERDAKTRLRIGKQDTDIAGDGIAYTGVLHMTSRPVGEKIDVQPHFHFIVANATWNPVEGRMKALQLQPFAANGAKEARPYYTAFFNARLAEHMKELGYQVTPTKDSFNIVGVPDSVRDEFSQRTKKIEAVAAMLEKQKQKFLGDPNAKLSAKTKGILGAKTREAKQPGKTWDSLMEHWGSRVSDEERQAVLDTVKASQMAPSVKEPDQSKAAMEWAAAHLFERSSVVTQRKLVTTALQHGLGHVTVEGVHAELASPKLIRREMGGDVYVTSREVLAEEKRIVEMAAKGRGRFRPLSQKLASGSHNGLHHAGATLSDPAKSVRVDSLPADTNTPAVFDQPNVPAREHPGRVSSKTGNAELNIPEREIKLTASQQAAVSHVHGSHDRVILIRGAAGTGKSTLMSKAVAGIEAGGHKVTVLAPSAEASRGVLRAEGFAEADTVAKFLDDREMQAKAKGQVIWVDEAGLLGAHSMSRLFQLADQLNARVVLSGDRRQHKSVSRGDPLALLEDRAGVPCVEVSDIVRQRGEYREAVKLLAKGDVQAGFDKLDALGWVKEVSGASGLTDMNVGDKSVAQVLVDDYMAARRSGKSVLVVSPTHAGGDAVTAEIRQRLREGKVLHGEDREFTALVPKHLTEAERSLADNYRPGDVVQFVRSAGDFKAGQRVSVDRAGVQDVARHGSKLALYHQDALRLAAGDAIRVTANGKDKSGKHRLNNGSQYTVAGFTAQGDIKLNNGWVLDKGFGHFAHGYVTTSHASQGKSVDVVLVDHSAASMPATGMEQFYVSASRGKQQAVIYTQDKQALKEAIGREDKRFLATDLVRQPRKKTLRQRLRSHLSFLRKALTFDRSINHNMEQTHDLEIG